MWNKEKIVKLVYDMFDLESGVAYGEVSVTGEATKVLLDELNSTETLTLQVTPAGMGILAKVLTDEPTDLGITLEVVDVTTAKSSLDGISYS